MRSSANGDDADGQEREIQSLPSDNDPKQDFPLVWKIRILTSVKRLSAGYNRLDRGVEGKFEG